MKALQGGTEVSTSHKVKFCEDALNLSVNFPFPFQIITVHHANYCALYTTLKRSEFTWGHKRYKLQWCCQVTGPLQTSQQTNSSQFWWLLGAGPCQAPWKESKLGYRVYVSGNEPQDPGSCVMTAGFAHCLPGDIQVTTAESSWPREANIYGSHITVKCYAGHLVHASQTFLFHRYHWY